jgi:predicted nuclease of restriction endonuclease-like (RecB) superfamily
MAAKRKIKDKGRLVVARPVRELLAALPPDYVELLDDLKDRIRRAQVRAAVAASRELVQLYWDIGREIVLRQEGEGWGKQIVDCLATDIQQVFPGIQGFSARNVWRMRAFFLAYAPQVAILTQLVSEFEGAILPQPVSEIPWGHNIVLFQQLKDSKQRLWYAEKVIQHGWSRAASRSSTRAASRWSGCATSARPCIRTCRRLGSIGRSRIHVKESRERIIEEVKNLGPFMALSAKRY